VLISDCERIVSKLNSEIEDYKSQIKFLKRQLYALQTEPRGIGTVISLEHKINGMSFYRVKPLTGTDICVPSHIGKIENGTEVLIVNGTIESTLPSALDQIMEKHTVTLASWDSVGGLKSQVTHIRETIELPLKHPEIFTKYGMRPVSGIFLYGEPGCGKTLIAQAIANTILGTGEAPEGAFVQIKGSDVLDKFIGESEKIITDLFKKCRKFMVKYKQRPVLFFDEAEALFKDRAVSNSQIVGYSCVPSFLAEMDGLYAEKPLVILASNRPEQIDPAILRDGRIDVKLHIDRPDRNDFRDIIKIHLKDKLCYDAVDTLAEYATNKIFSCPLYRNVSGSMAATLANLSTKEAIVRSLKDEKSQVGILSIDIDAFITNMTQEK